MWTTQALYIRYRYYYLRYWYPRPTIQSNKPRRSCFEQVVLMWPTFNVFSIVLVTISEVCLKLTHIFDWTCYKIFWASDVLHDNLTIPSRSIRKQMVMSLNFLPKYYLLNDLLWQEGFLIDFVQKKTTDKFIRKFLILSAYLFSERLVFDKLIRVYSDLVVLLTNKKSIYEYTSVAGVMMSLVIILSLLILLPTLLFFICGCFDGNADFISEILNNVATQYSLHCNDNTTIWSWIKHYNINSLTNYKTF